MTTITVAKWGNSVGVRLPKDIIANSHISVGDCLQVEVGNNVITLKKVRSPKKYRLEDVLERFDTPQLQGELDWGTDKGLEAW